MGDTERTSKPGKLSQIKAEFKKVIWPDKTTVRKETTAVVVEISSIVISVLNVVIIVFTP